MSSSTKRPALETDVLGRELKLREPPSRIVSLVPSLTESLHALGVGDRVVGITDYCIFPEIDPEVSRVGGTKNPDVDRIRKLRPDLVYVNVEENLKRHAKAIEDFAPVFATEPGTVMDVKALLEQLGRIHERESRAAALSAELVSTLSRARDSIRPFTFVCPIWKNPWMWCGGDTYVSDLVVSVGGKNLLGDRSRYPKAGIEEVAELNPDVVFLPDEPFEFQMNDADELRAAGFRSIVGPFPGHLFTWHGVRTIAGLEFLADSIAHLAV